eukprot:352038-Chlamydomonas_euryale.AAC.2
MMYVMQRTWHSAEPATHLKRAAGAPPPANTSCTITWYRLSVDRSSGTTCMQTKKALGDAGKVIKPPHAYSCTAVSNVDLIAPEGFEKKEVGYEKANRATRSLTRQPER